MSRDTNNAATDENPSFAGSLCPACEQVRRIVSGRGSVFLMCRLGQTEKSWPKYPPQPVVRCIHFRPEANDASLS